LRESQSWRGLSDSLRQFGRVKCNSEDHFWRADRGWSGCSWKGAGDCPSRATRSTCRRTGPPVSAC